MVAEGDDKDADVVGVAEAKAASPQAPPLEEDPPSSSLFALASARLGTSLRGKWRLDALLGVGGMASVYAATHRNGTRAAVKVLHEKLTAVPLIRQRFEWEARVANAVGHPGAVQVLDDDVAEDGAVFLVTELLEGETLADRRARIGGRMPAQEVLVVFDKVLAVLAAAHARGIVHRDLKPENLFVTCDGRIKVLDFGIARRKGFFEESRFTQAGETLGTPAYMSPEHARALWDEVDGQSDLWSVGASMFELLSGAPLRQGRTVNEELLEAMTLPPPLLSTVVPDVAPAIAQIVDRALAFPKEQRWPDAAAMQQAIEQAYLGMCGVSIGEAPPLSVPATSRPANAPFPGDWPPSRARAALTTDRPVVIPGTPRAALTHRLRTPVVSAALGGFVAACALAGVVGLALSSSSQAPLRPTAAAMSSAVASASAVAPTSEPAPPPAPVETLIPEVEVSALPEALSAGTATPRTSNETAAGAGCVPPYTVDPKTKKKRWKLQCL
jgi:serine/threonine-protein kinase